MVGEVDETIFVRATIYYLRISCAFGVAGIDKFDEFSASRDHANRSVDLWANTATTIARVVNIRAITGTFRFAGVAEGKDLAAAGGSHTDGVVFVGTLAIVVAVSPITGAIARTQGETIIAEGFYGTIIQGDTNRIPAFGADAPTVARLVLAGVKTGTLGQTGIIELDTHAIGGLYTNGVIKISGAFTARVLAVRPVIWAVAGAFRKTMVGKFQHVTIGGHYAYRRKEIRTSAGVATTVAKKILVFTVTGALGKTGGGESQQLAAGGGHANGQVLIGGAIASALVPNGNNLGNAAGAVVAADR